MEEKKKEESWNLVIRSKFRNHDSVRKCLVLAEMCGIVVNILFVDKLEAPAKMVAVIASNTLICFTTVSVQRFLAEIHGGLFGKNRRERALVNQWIETCNSSLDIPVAVLTFRARKLCTKSQAMMIAKAEGSAKMSLLQNPGILQHLDRYLEHNTFLVGERLSLADISVALSLRSLFFPRAILLNEDGVEIAYPHFWRWLRHILHQSACKDVFQRIKATTSD